MVKSKHKCFFDFEKEERWLAEMSAKGFLFQSVNAFGKYSFLMAEPHEYVYRVDYRTFKNESDFADYCALFEDSGWKHLSGSKNSGNQYFVKIKEDAADQIFSDSASIAGRYRRYCSMWATMFSTFVPLFVAVFAVNYQNLSAVRDFKSLYYTPGLWSMTGSRFWGAFLFETPFVIFRNFSWVIMIILLLITLLFYVRSYLRYRRCIK